ncbi:unnamed protein product [Caenorhabditis nigoni]
MVVVDTIGTTMVQNSPRLDRKSFNGEMNNQLVTNLEFNTSVEFKTVAEIETSVQGTIIAWAKLLHYPMSMFPLSVTFALSRQNTCMIFLLTVQKRSMTQALISHHFNLGID